MEAIGIYLLIYVATLAILVNVGNFRPYESFGKSAKAYKLNYFPGFLFWYWTFLIMEITIRIKILWIQNIF